MGSATIIALFVPCESYYDGGTSRSQTVFSSSTTFVAVVLNYVGLYCEMLLVTGMGVCICTYYFCATSLTNAK